MKRVHVFGDEVAQCLILVQIYWIQAASQYNELTFGAVTDHNVNKM
jgi:hypothetical protein